jgi:type I restriction enzyme S subunit
VKLGEYCHFTTGKLDSNQATPQGIYPFFTCSQETFKIDKYSFDCEAVLLSGNNARGIYSVKHYSGKFDAYQRTYVITIQDTNNLSYLYLKNALETKLEELRIGSIGTSTKFLTLKMLLNLQIPKPSIEQQHEIARMLSVIDNKIESAEKRKAALQTLFKSMLHNLMAGKVRVTDMEGNVA